MMDDPDAFAGEGSIDLDDAESSSLALFEGDEGELDLPVRQCLVLLLRRNVLTREDHPREWDALVNNLPVLRSRLHDVFLDLIVHQDKGVAFKVQIRSETPQQFPPLIRDAHYNREETILLVVLRQRLLAEAVGSAPVHIGLDECLTAVAQFRPAGATDERGDEAKARRAVEALHHEGILRPTEDDERFVISPVIESVLPLDRLKALLGWLTDQNVAQATDPADAGQLSEETA